MAALASGPAGIKRFPFSWRPSSLAWQGDDLVDWVDGGRRWLPDGTEIPAAVRYAYGFDRAVASPSGRYSVIFTERETKGLVLDQLKILREVDRSYYQSNAYAYPIALGCLPDGREVIAHCPKEYNRIEIETLDKGKRLTPRRRKAQDIFHSRLSFSPDGRFLLSAGWVWHPWNGFCVFDVARALEDPHSLDRKEGPFGEMEPSPTQGEVYAACWLDSERVLLTTDMSGEYLDEGESDSSPTSGVWSARDGTWISRSTVWNPQASLYPCAGGALYVENGYPHWWAPGRENPLTWPDITVVAAPGAAARQGIVHDSPLLAAHPTEPRFAVVTEGEIVVIEFGGDV